MKLKSVLLAAMIVLCLGTTARADDSLIDALENGRFYGDVRLLSFDRDYDQESIRDAKQMALGTNLYYETGTFLDHLSAGVGVRGNLNLDGPRDDTAYDLIPTDINRNRESYAAMQEYWVQGEWFDTAVKVGAQTIETPWLNSHDARVNPKKYRGVTVKNKSFDNLEIDVMQINDMMGWTSKSFHAISEFATTPVDKKRGVTAAGGKWSPADKFDVYLYDYQWWDMYNGSSFDLVQTTDWAKNFSTYSHWEAVYQKSTGEGLLGSFDTHQLGVDVGFKSFGAELNLQYANVGGHRIQEIGGVTYTICMQVGKSRRAGYNNYAAKLNYDFGYLGIKGLSAYVWYGYFDAPGSGRYASYDFDEIDFNLQYKFSGALKGWKVRARHAIVNGDNKQGGSVMDFNDTRLYLTYNFDIDFSSIK